MKRSLISTVLFICLIVWVTSADVGATFTVATFADPSNSSLDPLFEIDFTQMTIDGGWSDTQTGLNLNVTHSGNSFTDAWFEMTQVAIIDAFGNTGSGQIDFYANGTSVNPLVTISFASGYVDSLNFGADTIFIADNITITGSQISGVLSEENFSFSFANLAMLPGHTEWSDGFTATAAFTSSAVPEPATIALLSIGTIALIRRKTVRG